MAAWTDVREAILEELAVLMTGLSGIRSVWRNRGQLEESEGEGLPAIIVLDGREENTMEVPAQKTVVFPAVIMAMRPEIVVQLRPRDTVQNLLLDGQVDPPGPELSSWRQRIMQAIFNDQVIVGNPTPSCSSQSTTRTTMSTPWCGCRLTSPMRPRCSPRIS